MDQNSGKHNKSMAKITQANTVVRPIIIANPAKPTNECDLLIIWNVYLCISICKQFFDQFYCITLQLLYSSYIQDFLFKMTIYNTLQEKNETLQHVVYVHELETVGVLIQWNYL